MKEEFVMPGYFELLSMAEFDTMQASTLDLLKSSGVLGTLAILAVGVAWLFLVLGLATRIRGLLGVSILSALGAMLLGWGGSYLSYMTACRVVEASRTGPKDSELAGGATVMLFNGAAPTLAAFLPLLLAAAVMPFVGRKSE